MDVPLLLKWKSLRRFFRLECGQLFGRRLCFKVGGLSSVSPPSLMLARLCSRNQLGYTQGAQTEEQHAFASSAFEIV